MTKRQKVLITGGAGYIGSHVLDLVAQQNCEVFVLDDLSTGHNWAVRDYPLIRCNLLDYDGLLTQCGGIGFDSVMHFAAKSIVSDSVKTPLDYYQNNVVGSLNLMKFVEHEKIEKFIFSSTAAVYGNPIKTIIDEAHPINPINPYGRSKLTVESMLMDLAASTGINVVCFRYFNAAGANPKNGIGEAHEPETHLIPNILKSIATANAGPLDIFGDNYATHDGTCVRDYVHVMDIASAHVKGLEWLDHNSGCFIFNLGSGKGYSVLEVVKACEEITGITAEYIVQEPRVGDPPVLVANSDLAKLCLGWMPSYSLEEIISDAYEWLSVYSKTS